MKKIKKADITAFIKENKEKEITLSVCLLTAFLFLLFMSRSSFLYPINDWNDDQCYFTIGKSMLQGKVLYKNIFDHKGPYIYLIYGIGWLMSHQSFAGVFFIEILFFTAFLYFTADVIKRLSPYKYMWMAGVPVTAAVITGSQAFYYGGSSEELMLPLLMYGIDCVVAHQLSKDAGFSKKQLFLNGMAAGIIFLTKYTVMGIYIGFAVYIIASYVRRRGHWLDLLFIPAGFLTAAAPWLIYFDATESMQNFIDVYFVTNMSKYSELKAGSGMAVSGLKNIINLYRYTTYTDALLFFSAARLGMSSTIFSKMVKHREDKFIGMMLYLCMFAVLFAGGKYYVYYPLPLAVFIPFAFTFNFRLDKIPYKPVLAAIFAASSFALALRFSGNTQCLFEKTEDTPQYQFAEIIKESGDKSLLSLNCLDDGTFMMADVTPDVKYFQGTNLPRSADLAYQMQYVTDKKTEFIIIDSMTNLTMTSEDYVTLSENYDEVKSIKWHDAEFALFRRKEA